MSEPSTSSMSKRQAYEAYRDGELSEEQAREFFGEEYEDVLQLSRVEDVLDRQSEPDVEPDELHR